MSQQKTKRKIPTSIIVTVILLFSTLALRQYLLKGVHEKQNEAKIQMTLNSLTEIRTLVELYLPEDGKYPESLSEMVPEIPNELISSPEGNNKVSKVLDGTGGWYYSPEGPDIRINYTKPIKSKDSKYNGEIPSEL